MCTLSLIFRPVPRIWTDEDFKYEKSGGRRPHFLHWIRRKFLPTDHSDTYYVPDHSQHQAESPSLPMDFLPEIPFPPSLFHLIVILVLRFWTINTTVTFIPLVISHPSDHSSEVLNNIRNEFWFSLNKINRLSQVVLTCVSDCGRYIFLLVRIMGLVVL